MAEIYIQTNELDLAEPLIKTGLESATQARETPRIALYNASYTRFYYQLALKARQDKLQEESLKYINGAQDYATKALEIFNKELMITEKEEIIKLNTSIEEYKNFDVQIDREHIAHIAN